MNKFIKSDYIAKGMLVDFLKKPNPKLFNQIVGIQFKNIRLKKKLTAEAVVQDNKRYFNTIYDLYKFEKGIKTDVSKFIALSCYYGYNIDELKKQIKLEDKNVSRT
jgi:hypothetical protein